MTLRLILIRHGKSSWDDPFAPDHDRVLNTRGCASAKAIGVWMRDRGYAPDSVLCSDSVRTRETAALILPTFVPAPKLHLSARLYQAEPDAIFDQIRREKTGTLAVIGHNPGIGQAAEMLVSGAPDHPRFSDYPTCATTVIDFDIARWADLKLGQGSCVDFIVPRDLIGAAGVPG